MKLRLPLGVKTINPKEISSWGIQTVTMKVRYTGLRGCFYLVINYKNGQEYVYPLTVLIGSRQSLMKQNKEVAGLAGEIAKTLGIKATEFPVIHRESIKNIFLSSVAPWKYEKRNVFL